MEMNNDEITCFWNLNLLLTINLCIQASPVIPVYY